MGLPLHNGNRPLPATAGMHGTHRLPRNLWLGAALLVLAQPTVAMGLLVGRVTTLLAFTILHESD